MYVEEEGEGVTRGDLWIVITYGKYHIWMIYDIKIGFGEVERHKKKLRFFAKEMFVVVIVVV